MVELPTTTRTSILNIDMEDNEKATALYFENKGSTPFIVKNFNLTSTNGKGNSLVLLKRNSKIRCRSRS